MDVKLSPVRTRMLNILNDGLQHTMDELITALDDELAEQPRNAVRVHIFFLRKKLGKVGRGIVTEYATNGDVRYRQVTLVGQER